MNAAGTKIPANLLALLRDRDLLAADCDPQLLAGDGSNRLILRITRPDSSSGLLVLPDREAGAQGLAEARSTWLIGSHLRSRGIPVPEIYDYDEKTGLVLFEDLGDTLLHDLVAAEKRKKRSWSTALTGLYEETLDVLINMQIAGSVRFDTKWCWDTACYDKQLMLEKESGYFISAFCRDYLAISDFDDGLRDEFRLLAGRALDKPCRYFLHRDFQSRNLMVHRDSIRIIDFQGGRLGPLGYDLASLLLDPYADLPAAVKQDLTEYYLDLLCQHGISERDFLRVFDSLLLQRNLQIIGAFAHLSKNKGKKFFKKYIRPALVSLAEQLAKKSAADYPCLRKLTEKCLDRLAAARQ